MKTITQCRIKEIFVFLLIMAISISGAFAQSFTEVGSIPFTANNDGTNIFADIDV